MTSAAITSVIYFVRAGDGGPIKIGYTGNSPRRRLLELQVGCPWPLVLMGAIEGGRADERRLHLRLANARSNGEWFQPTEDVLAVVQSEIAAGRQWTEPVSTWQHNPSACELENWLGRNGVRRSAFAKMVSVTPQTITMLCSGEIYPSKSLAQRIFSATGGEVGPNHFLFLEFKGKRDAA